MKPYTHFTPNERICLVEMLKSGKKFSEIAKLLGRDRSTIYREVKRNSNEQSEYFLTTAMGKAKNRRKNSVRKPRIKFGSKLYDYVCEKLNALWMPDIISKKWNKRHPKNKVSAATIYRAIREGLLVGITPKTHLRRHGKKQYSKRNKFNTIQPDHTIHEWTKEIINRLRYGHWEGDTVRGAPGKGGALTLVERKSRYLVAIKIDNFSADTLYDAVMQALGKLVTKSITFDNGSEFARFKDMARDLNTTVYFADPHAPWQRGSNENTNDVLRFFFPKGTNFHTVSQAEIDEAVEIINNRPRLCLKLSTPKQKFLSHLT